MAGIYIHIPFCKEKCFYCDFYSGNQLYLIDEYVEAICHELRLRNSYISDNVINTVYFGGGTPSLLNKLQLRGILECIKSNFILSSNAEITLECNPENISEVYVEDLLSIGFNRISLGVQFLDNVILKSFNRQHTKELIFNALDIINRSKLDNLSVDLIFSVPGITDKDVQEALNLLKRYNISHYSTYCLTIASNTKLYWKIKKGDVIESQEDIFLSQYSLIQNFMEENGFSQYEVSNFSKDGYISKHNMGYWNQVPYLGAGVSAHSFNVLSRQWNHTNIKKYIRDLGEHRLDFAIEELTEVQRYNEYIILRLRTFLGLSRNYIQESFHKDIQKHFVSNMNSLKRQKHFQSIDDLEIPLKSDLLVADYLAKILMY